MLRGQLPRHDAVRVDGATTTGRPLWCAVPGIYRIQRWSKKDGCATPIRITSGSRDEGSQKHREYGGAAMKDVALRQPLGSEAACRHLALSVIQQAIRDLSGASVSPADQESARTFLSGSAMLYRWCEVANLNASRMVTHAAELLVALRPTRDPEHAPAKHARIRDL
jgi:hypothetical protein